MSPLLSPLRLIFFLRQWSPGILCESNDHQRKRGTLNDKLGHMDLKGGKLTTSVLQGNQTDHHSLTTDHQLRGHTTPAFKEALTTYCHMGHHFMTIEIFKLFYVLHNPNSYTLTAALYAICLRPCSHLCDKGLQALPPLACALFRPPDPHTYQGS